MPLTPGFGGLVFADGCDKSHIGAVMGTEAKLREGSIDMRRHHLFREALL